MLFDIAMPKRDDGQRRGVLMRGAMAAGLGIEVSMVVKVEVSM